MWKLDTKSINSIRNGDLMKPSFLSSFNAIWGIKKEFRLKVLFLTLSFSSLTACQAIWRPLKTVVFISMIGAKSIPNAKLFLMFPLIFLILIYSKLVDWLRRHQLFYYFTIFHGTIGIIFYFFLISPVYGIANTTQSKGRLLGWLFYLFLESFGAFMSATFWSFANSINTPKDAKNYYSLLVAGSKVGGITAAGSLFLLAKYGNIADTSLIPNSILAGSILIFMAGIAIYFLMKNVPGYIMHGYEASYQLEKKRETVDKVGILKSIRQSFDGLIIIIRSSYIFGIVSIIMAYEIIIVIMDYLVALAAEAGSNSAGELLTFYASYQLTMHSIGLLIALFGTAPLQRFLGIRLSLFAAPLISVFLLMLSFFYPITGVLFYTLVILRALNYGLNHPTREALFIPTTKAVKFKAKAWTDAFGSRLAKATGSVFNKTILHGVAQISILTNLGIVSVWLVITFFLGKTYQHTVDNNLVIGEKETE